LGAAEFQFASYQPTLSRLMAAADPPQRQGIAQRLRAKKRLVTVLALLLPTGCMTQPGADELLSPGQLSVLVTGHTLNIVPDRNGPFGPSSALCWLSPYGCGLPYETLLYLAPEGTGWLDSQLVPGALPRPGAMSTVSQWRIGGTSQICLWASPRVGEMPGLTPPHWECVQVLRTRQPPERLKVVVTEDGTSSSGSLRVFPFNAFPAPVIDQYLQQVRVLFGGRLPVWTAP
jgi:hypothetical protein